MTLASSAARVTRPWRTLHRPRDRRDRQQRPATRDALQRLLDTAAARALRSVCAAAAPHHSKNQSGRVARRGRRAHAVQGRRRVDAVCRERRRRGDALGETRRGDADLGRRRHPRGRLQQDPQKDHQGGPAGSGRRRGHAVVARL